MKVRDLMTSAPQTILPTETLATARERMEQGGFRRLPVVDAEGTSVGIITERDIREHRGHLADTLVSGAMAEPAITVGADDSADRVAGLLLLHRIGGLPVVDVHNRVVGVITETDLLRRVLPRPDTATTVEVACTDPSQTAAALVGLIEREGATVLAMHLAAADDAGRVYCLRVAEPRPGRVADALSEHGYDVLNAQNGKAPRWAGDSFGA